MDIRVCNVQYYDIREFHAVICPFILAMLPHSDGLELCARGHLPERAPLVTGAPHVALHHEPRGSSAQQVLSAAKFLLAHRSPPTTLEKCWLHETSPPLREAHSRLHRSVYRTLSCIPTMSYDRVACLTCHFCRTHSELTPQQPLQLLLSLARRTPM